MGRSFPDGLFWREKDGAKAGKMGGGWREERNRGTVWGKQAVYTGEWVYFFKGIHEYSLHEGKSMV